jgi:hypothetical protein
LDSSNFYVVEFLVIGASWEKTCKKIWRPKVEESRGHFNFGIDFTLILKNAYLLHLTMDSSVIFLNIIYVEEAMCVWSFSVFIIGKL